MSQRHFFGGKQLRVYEGCNRAPRCAVMHGARGDTKRARGTSTTPPSAARSARRTPAGASRRVSTAAPEAWHRSGTTPRAGTPRWPHTRGETTQALHMSRAAMPARLASFRLLAMASPPLDARRKLVIGQQTSGIVRGTDRRSTLLRPLPSRCSGVSTQRQRYSARRRETAVGGGVGIDAHRNACGGSAPVCRRRVCAPRAGSAGSGWQRRHETVPLPPLRSWSTAEDQGPRA